MQVRAAVARKAGEKLSLETVELDGPRDGEVLVEIKATGICHTDEYTLSGADPEGLFPAILGHEGAGVVVDVGTRRHQPEEGRPRHSALHAGMPAVRILPVAQDQSVRGDPRDAGQGRDAGRHQPVPQRQARRCSTTWAPRPSPISRCCRRSRWRRSAPDAPFDKVCYIGCGVTTGIGAVMNTAKVEAGARCVVFGLGGIGLNVIQGLRMVGAEQIVGVDLNPRRKAMAEKFGMTHFVNPSEVQGDLVPYLVDLTKGGADYSFECIGNVKVMRQALECAHRGWGKSIIIGVAGAGQEIATRPFQLVTGRVWMGTAFGGARGRTDVPRIVDWYMDKRINIDDLITHVLPFEQINEGFELMRRGELIRSVVTY